MPRIIRGVQFSHPVPAHPDGRLPVTSSGYGPREGGAFEVHYGEDIVYPMKEGEHIGLPVSVLSKRAGVYGWIMPPGTPALAAADGKVVLSKHFGSGGGVRVDHGNGIATDYYHLAKLLVPVGTVVRRGQPVGIIGNDPSSSSSLNHLHFQLRDNGKLVDPANYMVGWKILPNPYKGATAHPIVWTMIGVGTAAALWLLVSRMFLSPRYAFPQLGERHGTRTLARRTHALSAPLPRRLRRRGRRRT